MLIVSGGDLVGKSTFVKRAYAKLDSLGFRHMPHHLTRPPKNFDYYKGYLDLISPYTIWDRFALDSLAYRQIDSHPCQMTPMKWSLVEAACRHHGGFQVILCCRNDQTIVERYNEDRPGQVHMYPAGHAVRVNSTFRQMLNLTSVMVRGQSYRYRWDYAVYTDDANADAKLDECIEAYVKHFNDWENVNAG